MNVTCMSEKDLSRQLLGRSAVLGALALLSRAFGLLRDMAMAWLLGGGASSDMLVTAMRFPHAVRRLLGEGSLSMPLTSMFSSWSGPAAMSVYRALNWRLASVLAAATLVFILASPLLVDIFAPGFSEAESRASADLLRVCLPYVFMAGMSALGMAFLHNAGIFWLPALSPVLFNVVFILFIALAAVAGRNATWILAFGMSCAGCCQWLLQWLGMRLFIDSSPPDRHAPDATRKVVAGQAWTCLVKAPAGVAGAAGSQLSMICAMSVASWLGTGRLSALYYAERLLEMPMGVIGIAINMASLPVLSRMAAEGDFRDFEKHFLLGIRLTLLFSVPAAFVLWGVGPVLVDALLRHGSFDSRAATETWICLAIMVPCLPIMGLTRCLLCACNALLLFKRAAVSAITAIFCTLASTYFLPVIFAEAWRPIVPPLSYDIGLLAQAACLWRFFCYGLGAVGRRPPAIPWRDVLQPVAAGLLAGLAARFCQPHDWGTLTASFVSIAAGVAVMMFCLLLMRNTQAVQIVGWLLEKFPRQGKQ